MKQLTKKEIILETVEYYKTHNKGMFYIKESDYRCRYFTEGNMCAIGRCLIDAEDLQNKLTEKQLADKGVKYIANIFDFESLLKEQYRGHDISFWESLQRLHDSRNYFKELEIGNELTELGQSYVNNLLGIYEK